MAIITQLIAQYRNILIFSVCAFVIVLIAHICPMTTKIDTRTGDLWYCKCGVPFWCDRLNPKDREAIVTLASNMKDNIGQRWYTIRRVSTHNIHSAIRHYYLVLAAWSRTDECLSLAIMEDLIDYIHDLNAEEYGSFKCFLLLTRKFVELNEKPEVNGYYKISKNWAAYIRDDPIMKQYVESVDNERKEFWDNES